MKYALLVSFFALTQASPAWCEASRSLPKGEETPQVIEKVFQSPFGEVQFTSVGPLGHSGFLRNSRGLLMVFQSIGGPAVCEEWFMSAKGETVPSGCEFVFKDETQGTYQAVRSDEMEEATLFQATRGIMRGWRNYVAL